MLQLIVKLIKITACYTPNNKSGKTVIFTNCCTRIWPRTSFQSTSLHLHRPQFVITFYAPLQHSTSFLFVPLRQTSSHFIPIRPMSLHYTSYIGTTSPRMCRVNSTSSHFTSLHPPSLRFIPLRPTSSHCTLRFTSLHFPFGSWFSVSNSHCS
jgi:hypothetical protein